MLLITGQSYKIILYCAQFCRSFCQEGFVFCATIESTSKCKFVAKLGKMFEKDLIWGKEI